MNHGRKDFSLFVFQSVSPANTVNMNAPPLINKHLSYFPRNVNEART
jgi:hypothetical protein